MRKIWQALGDVSLLQWLFISIPGLAGAVTTGLILLDKQHLIELLLASVGTSILALAYIIRRRWPATRASTDRQRTGIRSQGSDIVITNGRIKNQTTAVDLKDSSLRTKNLDIK